MTTTKSDAVHDREDVIVTALHNEDADTLRQLATTAQDEEEHDELVRYANNIENAEWAHDRDSDNRI